MLVGEPTFPGCRIRVRAVGVFHMADEAGPDEKVLCVPLSDPSWGGISDVHDVPPQLRNEIEHFFQVYKDLENKTVADARLRQPVRRDGDHRRMPRAPLGRRAVALRHEPGLPARPQPGIAVALRNELVVRGDLDQAAVLHHRDAVGALGGREPVRDRDHRAPARPIASACSTAASVCGSSDEVASSSTITAGSASATRASETS